MSIRKRFLKKRSIEETPAPAGMADLDDEAILSKLKGINSKLTLTETEYDYINDDFRELLSNAFPQMTEDERAFWDANPSYGVNFEFLEQPFRSFRERFPQFNIHLFPDRITEESKAKRTFQKKADGEDFPQKSFREMTPETVQQFFKELDYMVGDSEYFWEQFDDLVRDLLRELGPNLPEEERNEALFNSVIDIKTVVREEIVQFIINKYSLGIVDAGETDMQDMSNSSKGKKKVLRKK